MHLTLHLIPPGMSEVGAGSCCCSPAGRDPGIRPEPRVNGSRDWGSGWLMGLGIWAAERRLGKYWWPPLFLPQTWPWSRHCRTCKTPSGVLSFSGPKLGSCEDSSVASKILCSGYRISLGACRTQRGGSQVPRNQPSPHWVDTFPLETSALTPSWVPQFRAQLLMI